MWIIIYLNQDAFAVDRADYLAKVKESEGDWTKVSEWVEVYGQFVDPTNKMCGLPFKVVLE